MTLSKTVLGLDLGVTSIGWALLKMECDENGNAFRNDAGQLNADIVDCGVRIFPTTTEAKTNEPKNRARRTKRGQRRLVKRKAIRRNDLRSYLCSNGLLPEIIETQSEKTFTSLGDPYDLRVRGLSEKLEPFQIGRALYHLSKRRGFLSNRKTGESGDDGKVLGGIKAVREALERDGHPSLGAYLAKQPKKRGYFTHRAMSEHEFESIWSAQSIHHPVILNDDLKAKIKNIIFYQRPIKSQRGLIGKCTFEPDKKRCDMARQEAQRVRYWQDLNNLQLQDPETLNWRPLTDEEKRLLANELERCEVLKYEKLRKLLEIGEDVRINLQANDKKIKGNTTAYYFRNALKKTSKPWDSLNEEEQNRLVEELFRIENEIALDRRLKEFWGFDDEAIDKLRGVWHKLEDGYSRLSLKAIRKVLPLMMLGKRYDEAVTTVYGDHRKTYGSEEYRKLEMPPNDLRNPVVYKALCETRKVVNAIIRTHGLPDEIRVEMARDLKLTALQKEAAMKQQNANKKANERAEAFFKEKFGLENISSTDKLKFRLWEESGGRCPYTGKVIPPEALLDDGLVDLEHIIPYSRCFDDSYMNKTICDAKFNREVKRNRAPGEIYDRDSQQFFELMERVKDLPPGKRRKFEMTRDEIEHPEKYNKQNKDWAGRLLSDTRYICREVRGYLRQLYPYSPDESKYVQVVAGGATANLRHVWHVNAILADGDIDVKNRWDHRHHAIDAIVVALVDRGLYQYISKLAGHNRELMKRKLSGFSEPWPGFLNDVNEAIEKIIVSHAPMRRVRGPILKDTAYGATAVPGVYVVKRGLEGLTNSQIEKIVDPVIRDLVELRVREFNGDLKKAFAEPLFHKDGTTPIRTVRTFETMSPETMVGIKNGSGDTYKFYSMAGNHHVDIFENNDTGERTAILVPLFHAAQREWKPKELGPGWNKLFSLCGNDTVEFQGNDGKLGFYRVQKMSAGDKPRIDIRPVEDARTDYIGGYTFALSSSPAYSKISRKVDVDPIGRVTKAGD